MTDFIQRSKKLFAFLCMLSLLSVNIITGDSTDAFAKAKKPALSKKSITLKVKKSKTIKLKNVKKTKVTWKSKNKKIATVKKKGAFGAKITAKKKGSTKVYASFKVGKKKKKIFCSVKVKSSTADNSNSVQKVYSTDKPSETMKPDDGSSSSAKPGDATPVPSAEAGDATPAPSAEAGDATPAPSTVVGDNTPAPSAPVGDATEVPSDKPDHRMETTEANLSGFASSGTYGTVTFNEDGSFEYDSTPSADGANGSVYNNGCAFYLDRINKEPVDLLATGYKYFSITIKTDAEFKLMTWSDPDLVDPDNFWDKNDTWGGVYKTIDNADGSKTLIYKVEDIFSDPELACSIGFTLKSDGADEDTFLARKATVYGMQFDKELPTEGDGPAPATQNPVTQQPATQKPATQQPATQQPATQKPSVTEKPTATPDLTVRDINIDLSKLEKTTFTGPAKVDVTSQMESRFDLKYFESVVIEYTVDVQIDCNWTDGKASIAGNESQLTGYDNGEALSYGFTKDNTSVTIGLTDKSGPCVGFNFQPAGAGWSALEGLNSFTITSIKFKAKAGEKYDSTTPDGLVSLKEAYNGIFDNMGTCINLSQLKSPTTLAYVKNHYSSVSLENEMKPDAIIGNSWNKDIIDTSVAKANTADYVIPSSYVETKIPKLHYETVDQVLKLCKDNGLKLRAHTLVWHSQTPEWFFKENYEDSGNYVSKEVMNRRLEMYVRSVIHHVYTKDDGAYKDVVYTWDVANEYMNNQADINWSKVYGNRAGDDGLGNKPSYLKLAFETAYDELTKLGLNDKISLMYNDFNTYLNTDKIIDMVNYINEGEANTICNGVGMQSHLDINFPSADGFVDTVKAFVNAGFEVQITELDVTINATYGNYDEKGETDEQQAAYFSDLMKKLVAYAKTKPGKITGLTLWGLYDSVSWRGKSRPLLFGTGLTDAKPSYYKFIEAAKS